MRKRILKVVVLIVPIVALIIYAGFLNENVSDRDADHHDHSDHYHEHSHSENIILQAAFSPWRDPDRVILNLTESPETSIAVNWRTDTTIVSGTVEWAEATAGTEFLNNKKSVAADKERLKVKHLEEAAVVANYFSAKVEGLTPGAKYVYRVGTTRRME